MKLRICTSLLFLLTLTWSTPAQTVPPLSADRGSAGRQTSPTSATYDDTSKMLKGWFHSEKNSDLAHLFAMDDSRVSDLRAACRSADDEIASAAFLVLQLLGKPGCVDCRRWISRKHKGFASVCGSNLADGDFKRIEESLDEKDTEKGYECGDDPEPSTPLDDSLVYALVLDGSPRSRSVLHRMLAFEETCTGGYIVEILKQAQSLIEDAKGIGHNLRFQPDDLESRVRASAFFLPAEHRKDSRVQVIAYNNAGNRLLLEVSYTCGLLCGSGYHVVLRKDGAVWQYAVIRMAWIS